METNDIMYAPVIIPTLCRYEHLRACIESLSRCLYANHTDLIIALDYPLYESHVEGYKKIKEYLPTVVGFKHLYIIEREKNFGAVRNLNELVKYVCKRYEYYILTEDDNVFSPCFLQYENEALIKYKENSRVMAVCGYNFPISIKNYNKNVYFSSYYSAWGVGRWSNKTLKNDVSIARKYLSNPINLIPLLWYSPFIVAALLESVKRNVPAEDTLYVAYSFVNKKYTLFPVTSMVKNYGHDGSGENGGRYNESTFKDQYLEKKKKFHIDDISVEDSNVREVNSYFSLSRRSTLSVIKSLLYYYLKRNT